MRYTLFLAIVASAAIVGCDTQPGKKPAATAESASIRSLTTSAAAKTAVVAADSGPEIPFTCGRHAHGTVQYIEADGAVVLRMSGKRYRMTAVRAASGSRYSTTDGMAAGRRLTWWSKGDEAQLIESDLTESAGGRDTTMDCTTSPTDDSLPPA